MQVTTNNDISWLVVAAADLKWAELVFPELKGDEAVQALWQAIFKTTLVDQADPVAAWQIKLRTLLTMRTGLINKLSLPCITRPPGTDLTVGLPKVISGSPLMQRMQLGTPSSLIFLQRKFSLPQIISTSTVPSLRRNR